MSEQCPKRQKLNIINRDGSKETVQQCTEPTSEHFAKLVAEEQCNQCSVREWVLKQAKQRTPPKPEPIKSKHQAAAKALPKADCQDLKVVIKVKCCGEIVEKTYCHSIQSVYNGKSITPVICSTCLVRRPK